MGDRRKGTSATIHLLESIVSLWMLVSLKTWVISPHMALLFRGRIHILKSYLIVRRKIQRWKRIYKKIQLKFQLTSMSKHQFGHKKVKSHLPPPLLPLPPIHNFLVLKITHLRYIHPLVLIVMSLMWDNMCFPVGQTVVSQSKDMNPIFMRNQSIPLQITLPLVDCLSHMNHFLIKYLMDQFLMILSGGKQWRKRWRRCRKIILGNLFPNHKARKL